MANLEQRRKGGRPLVQEVCRVGHEGDLEKML